MSSQGVEPNTITYNIFMDGCAKTDDAEGAEKWLERMLERKIPANEVSYATVIHARAKRGDTSLAEMWLRKMIDAGVEPSVVSQPQLSDGLMKWSDVGSKPV